MTAEPDLANNEEGDDEEAEDSELVGYLEDPPSAEDRKLLTRRNFPSKVGGKPAWLIPKNLPELTCRKCARPMRFLLQSYASRGWVNSGAFHRVVHIFVCTSCQPNEVVAYRAQLPRENDFYSSDPPDQEQIMLQANNDPELEELICWECGLPCGVTPLDPDVEEVSTEPVVANRCDECARRLRNGDCIAVFEERELTCCDAEEPEDEEDLEGGEDAHDEESNVANEMPLAEAEKALGISMPAQGADDAALMEKLQEFRDRVKDDPEHALDKTEQRVFDKWSKEKGVHDKAFSSFQKFSTANPLHVVRYMFGGEPLWFCDSNQLKGKPPDCPLCSGPRVFEIQVQPQLIALLSEGALPELGKRLDFGVFYVFVCENSCNPKDDEPYVEEFVHVQPEPREAWLPK